MVQIAPLLRTLAPAEDRGWGRVGPSGAGHFTKMVHNGIEYGMMQAYAEGFALMERKQEMELDLAQVAEVWRHGSVVRSWLLDLSTEALKRNPSLDGIAPYVEDSGEGRWTVAEAIALDVPAPVITLSLLERLRSRESNSFTDRLLSAMRNEFGGHAIVSTKPGSDPFPQERALTPCRQSSMARLCQSRLRWLPRRCVDQGRHLPSGAGLCRRRGGSGSRNRTHPAISRIAGFCRCC